MTAQEDLEAACKAIRESAEANCPICNGSTSQLHPFIAAGRRHTCRVTIDTAAEGMLAAALAGWNSNCDSAFAELNAEINRLRAHEALIKEIKRGDWPPKEE